MQIKQELNKNPDITQDLIEAILSIKDKAELADFLKDLCTPQEINSLSERWRVCKLLNRGNLSYREIHDLTGASLATITRVARFLKDEPHHGYRNVLKKMDLKDNASTRSACGISKNQE